MRVGDNPGLCPFISSTVAQNEVTWISAVYSSTNFDIFLYEL